MSGWPDTLILEVPLQVAESVAFFLDNLVPVDSESMVRDFLDQLQREVILAKAQPKLGDML